MSPTPLAPRQTDRLAQLYDVAPIRALALRARAHRWHLWAVGGPVRDTLAGGTPHDLDLVSDARPVDNLALLRSAGGFGQLVSDQEVVRGKVPGTGGELTSVDIAALHDGPSAQGDQPLLRDLSLRDLTVNAAALDLVTGILHDPYDASGALRARVLDTPLDPRDTFGADPIRVVRALRFEATWDLAPTPRVLRYQQAHAADMPRDLAPRVYTELVKIAAAGPDALVRALRCAHERGFAHRLVPVTTSRTPHRLVLPAGCADPLGAALRYFTADLEDPRPALRACGVPRREAQRLHTLRHG